MVADRILPSRFAILGLLIVGCLVLAACSAGLTSDDLEGVVVESPQEKPSFTLTDTSGEPYEFFTQTESKLALLYFGYVNCPDICPVHLAQIAEVLDRAPDVERKAEVVFVSVDPGRDTPEVIREFLDNFSSDFVGLTGTEEELELAQEAAGVPPAIVQDDGEDYTVDHAGWVIAYAPDGLNYSIYPFGTRQSQWNNDLELLAAMEGSE